MVAPRAVGAVPRLHAGLVGVDDDLQAGADGVADGSDYRNVVARVVVVEAQLEGAEALGLDASGVLDALHGGAHLAGGTVGRDSALVAAPQFVDRESGAFADDVP